jgi:predicted nucleotide-binding protein
MFPTPDKITLIKPTGERIENIAALVQSKLVFIKDGNLPIEEGDLIERILPNRLTEKYRVIERGYYTMPQPHYQVKVEKIQQVPNISQKSEGVKQIAENGHNDENSQELKNASHFSEIFIVHGHDHTIRDTVALYVTQFGLKPIILADKASGGKTLIEKLEEYRQVQYAIILLTPDDTGCTKEESEQTNKPVELKTRARQNVIFELGLFIGWLGRERVCPIVKTIEELPSDYLGIVYVPYDINGAWKLHLVRELGKAGYNIDSKRI